MLSVVLCLWLMFIPDETARKTIRLSTTSAIITKVDFGINFGLLSIKWLCTITNLSFTNIVPKSYLTIFVGKYDRCIGKMTGYIMFNRIPLRHAISSSTWINSYPINHRLNRYGRSTFFSKNGEVRGGCAGKNPMMQEEGVACTMCGAMPTEECKSEEAPA